MVSGSIVLQRCGRWETRIDFSFCWGKQACCSWARVQWGGQNVLDCSSSLSPREPRLPQDTLRTINTRKLGKHCRHVLVIFSPLSRQQWSIRLQFLKAKRAGGENLAAVPRRKLSQHHPRKQRTRAGQSYLAIAHGVGPGRAETLVKHGARCNRSQAQRGNPATNVSVTNISTFLECSGQNISNSPSEEKRLDKDNKWFLSTPSSFCSLLLSLRSHFRSQPARYL